MISPDVIDKIVRKWCSSNTTQKQSRVANHLLSPSIIHSCNFFSMFLFHWFQVNGAVDRDGPPSLVKLRVPQITLIWRSWGWNVHSVFLLHVSSSGQFHGAIYSPCTVWPKEPVFFPLLRWLAHLIYYHSDGWKIHHQIHQCRRAVCFWEGMPR